MRRAEVAVLSVVLAAVFGLIFWAAGGALPGAISAVVVLALGALCAWFLRRRFRARMAREVHSGRTLRRQGTDAGV